MKLLLLTSLLLVVSTASLSQYADTSSTMHATDYLKKSKNQKTAAWILLGGGALVTTVGIAVGLAESTEAVLGAFSGEDQSSFSSGALLTLTGLAAMVGSIPLFIASGKNRRKAAATVSFKMEKATIINTWVSSVNRYPSLAIRVRL